MITGGTDQKEKTAGRILPTALEREEYFVALHRVGSIGGYSLTGGD